MNPAARTRRPLAARVLPSIALIALLAACTPAPEPRPTPTAAFATEEEAFAAAEETFHRYSEALNNIDTADPASFEPIFALSSGSVEKADRENFSTMHAEGWTITGRSKVLSFEGIRSHSPFNDVEAAVCLDVSEVEVVDAEGRSVVDGGRPDVYRLRVTLKRDESTSFLVDSARPDADLRCPSQ